MYYYYDDDDSAYHQNATMTFIFLLIFDLFLGELVIGKSEAAASLKDSFIFYHVLTSEMLKRSEV